MRPVVDRWAYRSTTGSGPQTWPRRGSGFTELTRIAREQCDAWIGLAAAGAGDNSARVVATIWRTLDTLGALTREIELGAEDLGFTYDTGLYLQFRATSRDDIALAYAAALGAAGEFADADDLVGIDLTPSVLAAGALGPGRALSPQPALVGCGAPLTPIVNDPKLDEHYAHAARVTLAIALANLAMFAPALSHLENPEGPVAVAAVDGGLVKGLCLRAQGEEDEAADVLAELYAANPEHDGDQEALSDRSFGLDTTTAARIEARSNPWDPRDRTGRGRFRRPRRQGTQGHLLIEAEAEELAEFIGLEEVKNQVARLKSSVAMSIRRQERGLAVAQRTNHLVFAGPPGTGKTTIARVVAKIYCGLGLLKKETVREVHRADLIGQHIGETEAKTNAIIDSALDGVLFLDEAYALVSTGAKNDFGLVAIDTLLARMENDRDRLVVIVAGYRADLDRFLDTNEGLRSRFTRSIDFPSYSAPELVEMATAMAEKRDSIFEQVAHDEMETLFAHLAASTTPDATGTARRSLDIAGNGRFVRNLVERSEEEREYRLDHSDRADRLHRRRTDDDHR